MNYEKTPLNEVRRSQLQLLNEFSLKKRFVSISLIRLIRGQV